MPEPRLAPSVTNVASGRATRARNPEQRLRSPSRRSGPSADSPARPLVSVVVPVYRTEKYFEGCLSSLLRQTFTDFEIIVVDDASPRGGVAEIVRAAGDGRVTMIRHGQNLGLIQALVRASELRRVDMSALWILTTRWITISSRCCTVLRCGTPQIWCSAQSSGTR